jgi:hypothetical protein
VILAGRKRVITSWQIRESVAKPHVQLIDPPNVLPTIPEDTDNWREEEEEVWDPNNYGGWVHNGDPYDDSDMRHRYFAFKEDVGDMEWVNNNNGGIGRSCYG